MTSHQLTVVALKADTVETPDLGGPPSVVIGGWVEVTATDGEITVVQRVQLEQAPRLGDSITVDMDAEH